MHSGIYSNIADLLSFRFQIKRKKLTNQQTLISTKAGYHQAIRKGRGMAFTEVREYQAGDEVRHIDWKVSARTQKTHTKVFTEELEKPIICLVEQSSKIFFGSKVRFKTVQAMNVAAIIGWVTLNHGDKFGALAFNNWQATWHKPKQNHQALLQFLHSSIDLQTQIKSPLEESQQSWEQQLELIKKQISSGNRIFLIGDFLQQSTEFFQNIAHFRKKNQLTLIHIFDPLDKKIPKAGYLAFPMACLDFV